MTKHRVSIGLVITTFLLIGPGLAANPAQANVRLPSVIGEGMVLQRDMPVPIWGWAEPGEEIAVKLADHEVQGKADETGKWSVKLPAMPAGGPYEMAVTDKSKNPIRLSNIMIGEVWICSGQSNMEMGIACVLNAEQEIAAARYPNIRLLFVPKRPAGNPEADFEGKWEICRPEIMGYGGWGGFSAVAYFFARELHQKLKVPIGVIDTSWGGTRIEPWTPQVGFSGIPALVDVVREIEAEGVKYHELQAQTLKEYEKWIPQARTSLEARKPIPAAPAWPPHHPLQSHQRPTGLYNGMIHPLVPFAIRGAIWYQGESNHQDGMRYHEMMKALIGGWRQVWGQGDFPFYYVQLAPYSQTPLYSDDQLPKIWEAQTASLSIPNTGMAVTTDITDLNDIHPKNKQDVGKRLALWALARDYGFKDIVYSGPLYKSMSVEGNKIRIQFDHVGSGLASRDGKPLSWFEIASQDRKFVKAMAEIDNNSLVVSGEGISEPAAVRFAWSYNAEPNLMNKEGLPASSFRTDRW